MNSRLIFTALSLLVIHCSREMWHAPHPVDHTVESGVSTRCKLRRLSSPKPWLTDLRALHRVFGWRIDLNLCPPYAGHRGIRITTTTTARSYADHRSEGHSIRLRILFRDYLDRTPITSAALLHSVLHFSSIVRAAISLDLFPMVPAP